MVKLYGDIIKGKEVMSYEFTDKDFSKYFGKEEDFKKVVLDTGFKFEGIKRVGKPLNSLRETELFIEQNPGILVLKTF